MWRVDPFSVFKVKGSVVSGCRPEASRATYTPGSGLPLDHTSQVQLALSRHDGLPILQVIVDQVADALKQHVLRPNLWRQRSQHQHRQRASWGRPDLLHWNPHFSKPPRGSDAHSSVRITRSKAYGVGLRIPELGLVLEPHFLAGCLVAPECPCPNPWNLRVRMHLEKASLQM